MWLTFFIAFVYVIILLRLLIFAISSGSFEDKLGKMKNWFFGLFLLSLSWLILSKMFGLGDRTLNIGNNQTTTEVQKTIFDDENTNQNDDDQNNSDDGVPIILN